MDHTVPRALSSVATSLRIIPTVGLVGVEEMLRTQVVDREGGRIGTLRDLMVDLRRARVAYGVVAIDQPWGERLVAVPWNAMSRDDEGHFRVNALRQWVECAPSVKADNLASLLDHDWATLVHSYFGTKPYWEHSAQHS